MKLDISDIKTKEVLSWKGIHLLHFKGSTCSQKLRIFLNIKNIDWHSHEINLIKQEQFSEWFLGINPRGLVPTLVDNGEVHIESNDIMMHLDEKFTNNKLYPDDKFDEIVSDLAFEDSLHHDLRRLTFRYIIPHSLGKKDLKKLSFKESYIGTINGKEDEHKERELLFWKNHYDNGITDKEVIESASKFKEIYTKFDSQLQTNKYLKGNKFTIVDLAWYVSTKRLFTAGIPINKYENVKRWFNDLDSDKRFSNEIKIDGPIVLFKQILKIKYKMMGKYLTDLVKF